MSSKPVQPKIHKGILNTEQEDKGIHENKWKSKSHRWVDKQIRKMKESNTTKTKWQELLIPFNNNAEWKWSQYSTQETQTGGLD
jgi:hypothetical protein